MIDAWLLNREGDNSHEKNKTFAQVLFKSKLVKKAYEFVKKLYNLVRVY